MISRFNSKQNIQTDRLVLLLADEVLLEKVLTGETELKNFLQIDLEKDWCSFGIDIFDWSLQKIKENPDSKKWFSYFIVYKEENKIIGTCGFKGPPERNGLVEIGYEIAPSYRRKGLATEAAVNLVSFAMYDDSVKKIIAHTPVENMYSQSVLSKIGMQNIGRIHDNEDGDLYKWEMQSKVPV